MALHHNHNSKTLYQASFSSHPEIFWSEFVNFCVSVQAQRMWTQWPSVCGSTMCEAKLWLTLELLMGFQRSPFPCSFPELEGSSATLMCKLEFARDLPMVSCFTLLFPPYWFRSWALAIKRNLKWPGWLSLFTDTFVPLYATPKMNWSR